MSRLRRTVVGRIAACLIVAGLSASCATGGLNGGGPSGDRRLPGRTVAETLRRAIALLEAYECTVVAVDFLSPIKRAQIPDLEAYGKGRACSPDDRGNLDTVLLALRLSLGAEPERRGVRAIIDLSNVGLPIAAIELIRYTDGRWYFNGL